MSSSKSKTFNISINFEWKDFFVILQIILVILKLCGVVTWSWWVVLLPTIVPVGGVICVFVIMLILALVSPQFRQFIHDYKTEEEEQESHTIVNVEKKVEIEINGADDENNNKR